MNQERSLLLRIRNGDPRAFQELVEEHKHNVYYLAMDLVGNHFDAEDISQEVFIKVHKSIGRFQGDAKLSTWLYRITMNTYLDRRRKKSLKVVSISDRREDNELDPLDIVADGVTGNPERETSAAKIDEHINEALQALSEKERSVFVMRHYHDLSIKEIAGALEIADGTVKSLLFRSIRKLRGRLAKYREELGLEDSAL